MDRGRGLYATRALSCAICFSDSPILSRVDYGHYARDGRCYTSCVLGLYYHERADRVVFPMGVCDALCGGYSSHYGEGLWYRQGSGDRRFSTD